MHIAHVFELKSVDSLGFIHTLINSDIENIRRQFVDRQYTN